VAEEASEEQAARLEAWDPSRAPAGSREEYLACCGVAALGPLLAAGRPDLLERLRRHASDPRWRVREAVAIALQRWGDDDLPALHRAVRDWAGGGTPPGTASRLEQRAAAAALCEPRLLRTRGAAAAALEVLDAITATVEGAGDRREEAFRTLRQALGYCWSVAVAADPEAGLPRFERWAASPDPDLRWIVRENLRKQRLRRLVPES
jgi:hypothetical protein